MARQRISTDYLVIGSGAAGMAFTDALLAHSDASVVLVDRRHAPGGHWNDSYSFCRLHQPSAFYGVDSLPLGRDTVDTVGLNRGGYERATAAEIRGYYQRVLDERFLPTGRVRHLPMSDHVGDRRVVSRVTGDEVDVEVRARIVDANYLGPRIPATSPPPFEVAPDARCVTVNALAHLESPGAGYVIVGGGKTSMDAIIWLLEQGTDPEVITWIKPREAWLTNRDYFQPLSKAGSFIENASYFAEAGARADSVSEFVAHLHANEVLLRVDESEEPAMAMVPTINAAELAELRRIRNVVRLGHVRRITRNEIVLDHGRVATTPDHVHVHCATAAIPKRPLAPVFTEDHITLQYIRYAYPCLSAGVAGFLEATRGDTDEKNRLSPPHGVPDNPIGLAEMIRHSMTVSMEWSGEPDLTAYVDGSRLNGAKGWKEQLGEAHVQAAIQRYIENVEPAIANLERLTAGEANATSSTPTRSLT